MSLNDEADKSLKQASSRLFADPEDKQPHFSIPPGAKLEAEDGDAGAV